MSNQSIKYGILLTKEQLDFLKDDRQGFHRMTAFDTFPDFITFLRHQIAQNENQ